MIRFVVYIDGADFSRSDGGAKFSVCFVAFGQGERHGEREGVDDALDVNARTLGDFGANVSGEADRVIRLKMVASFAMKHIVSLHLDTSDALEPLYLKRFRLR